MSINVRVRPAPSSPSKEADDFNRKLLEPPPGGFAFFFVPKDRVTWKSKLGYVLPIYLKANLGLWVQEGMQITARQPEEIHQRLAMEWGTIGVVAALLLAMAYPSYESPPDVSPEHYRILQFQACLMFWCIASFFFSLVLVVLLSMCLNTVRAEDALKFADEFKMFMPLPESFLFMGMLTALGAIVLKTYLIYGTMVFIVSLAVCGLGWIFIYGCMIHFVFRLNREGGLWHSVTAHNTRLAAAAGEKKWENIDTNTNGTSTAASSR